MMTIDRLGEAVANNVAWCDAVCRAAGGDCRVDDDLWCNHAGSPRNFPNAITRRDAGSVNPAAFAALASALGADRVWGVKDSFARLDLARLGFDPLFEAQWIGRPASALEARPDPRTLRWHKVDSADGLAAWEAAWASPEGDDSDRVFAAALLHDPAITFLAGSDGVRLCCGAAVSCTGRVLGLGNLFALAGAPPDWRAQAVQAAQAVDPGRDLVGYEGADELAAFQALGFEALGPLRIWLRRPGAAQTGS